MNRNQIFKKPTRHSNIGNKDRPLSQDEPEKNMWSSLLDSVASGKKLPEKNLLVLGGNPENQKEFLDLLQSDATKRPQERNRRMPPVANEFALGYTYHDVLDADQDDILARLSIHLLSDPSPAFAPLVVPLITPSLVPNMLVIILLDWSEPWRWVRQLRDRILFLEEVLSSVDEDTKNSLAETMKDWLRRRSGGSIYESETETDVTIPLGQGEWDEPLGLPLCVVCHSADKIDLLEKEQGWQEEEFDFILQFLRTILIKHGASLIYTSVSVPNSLPTLIHSTLGIQSLLKKETLKHNVVDRDRILVPPNWDSWGKIRVLREGFDVESISSGWSSDIKPSLRSNSRAESNGIDLAQQPEELGEKGTSGEVVSIYENTIKDPRPGSDDDPMSKEAGLEIEVVNNQEFLASQLAIMERLKAEEEKNPDTREPRNTLDRAMVGRGNLSGIDGIGRVHEHIGPVQFNMGGIQADSDGMLNRPRDGDAVAGDGEVQMPKTPDGKAQNEALASFFAGLMERGATSSPRSSIA